MGVVPEGAAWYELLDVPADPTPTQHDLDYRRYWRRAEARDSLAGGNGGQQHGTRARRWVDGADLQSLMADPLDEGGG